MDTMHFARTLAFSALVLLTGSALFAQQPGTPAVAYVVSGLTASGRDQITHQVDQQGTVRLAYACVPAGILVFEPVNGSARADIKRQVEGIMATQLGRASITEITLDQQQLEAQCAALRNP
jgi:hypothetical protein